MKIRYANFIHTISKRPKRWKRIPLGRCPLKDGFSIVRLPAAGGDVIK